MRPDELDGTARGETVVPFGRLEADPDLDSLEAELAGAGHLARGARAYVDLERPSPAFAAALRERLLARLPAAPAVSPGGASAPQRPGLARSAVRPAGRPAPSWRRQPGAAVAEVDLAPVVRPHVVPRTATVLPAPRWTALGIAAALILSVIGLRATLDAPVAPPARAGDVVGASLVRDGSITALAPGAALHEGDRVEVGVGGHASLEIGSSVARLAGGAVVRIDRLSASETILDQVDGRAWHRVVPRDGMTYVVRTAELSWTAMGTAFDLNRSRDERWERLELLAIQHAVVLDGPGLRATIEQGRRALITFGDGRPDLSTGEPPAAELRDPWIVTNAALDRELGLGLGILEGSDEPSASPSPTTSDPAASSTSDPTVQPTTTASTTERPVVTPAPTPKPTPKPTPRPTPTPTPRPTATPAPEIASLGLALTGCPGGVVVDWEPFAGDRFDRYVVLRSAGESIPAAYPPSVGSIALEWTVTHDQAKTSAADSSVAAGSPRFYRALALDAANRVIGATAVKPASAAAVRDLGELTVGPAEGGTSFGWSPYGGDACFSFYKLVYSAEDATPSYLEGAAYAWVGEDPTAGAAWVGALPSGTYWFRVQVIRVTDLGKFVVAQTSPRSYAVP